MNLSGWELDLPAVYGFFGWRRRERFHLMERLYAPPDGSCAVLFYAIGEVGVNRQIASVALFKERSAPRRVWTSGRTSFWFEGHEGEPVEFLDGGRARLYEFVSGAKGLSSPERILDLAAGKLLPR